VITEWKALRIDYIDIPVSPNIVPDRENKAEALSRYTLSQILQLKFCKHDRLHRAETVEEWIKNEAAPQLRSYIKSIEVQRIMQALAKRVNDNYFHLRASLVVVVGSRHILVWDLDSTGKLTENSLAGVRTSGSVR